MKKIVYYVAMSLDGFISGPNDSIEGYVDKGSGLDHYLVDLKTFDTVIMGRKTYEFGFKFGLIPGQPAYKHMQHYIFSDSASYQNLHPQVRIVARELDIIKQLKQENGAPIYLCGGSIFAGWLLNNGLIDEVKIKLSPFLFGDGLPLFSGVKQKVDLELFESQPHDHGMMILNYNVKYK